MDNDNIPTGYDENGVYRGNGRWYDEDEQEQGSFDEYDFLKGKEGHFVECEYCSKFVNVNDCWDIDYGTRYACEKCKNKLSKLSGSVLWRVQRINMKK